MEVKHDGVKIFCLPDSAKCCADEERRSPTDINDCPLGWGECNCGKCSYYTED